MAADANSTDAKPTLCTPLRDNSCDEIADAHKLARPSRFKLRASKATFRGGKFRKSRSCEASQEIRPPNVRVKNGTEKSRCQRCIAPIVDLASESVCPGVRASRAIVAVRDQSDRTNPFAPDRL